MKKREWLIELRGDLTQQQVADLAEVSRGAYANIEIGQKNPSVVIAKRIANALEFNWTIFFEDEVVETKQKIAN